jgi:hypothetical protein
LGAVLTVVQLAVFVLVVVCWDMDYRDHEHQAMQRVPFPETSSCEQFVQVVAHRNEASAGYMPRLAHQPICSPLHDGCCLEPVTVQKACWHSGLSLFYYLAQQQADTAADACCWSCCTSAFSQGNTIAAAAAAAAAAAGCALS